MWPSQPGLLKIVPWLTIPRTSKGMKKSQQLWKMSSYGCIKLAFSSFAFSAHVIRDIMKKPKIYFFSPNKPFITKFGQKCCILVLQKVERWFILILESPWWELSPKANNSKIWDFTLGPLPPKAPSNPFSVYFMSVSIKFCIRWVTKSRRTRYPGRSNAIVKIGAKWDDACL